MATKPVSVFANQRINGDIVSAGEAQGTTEDEGQTCVLLYGYLPWLADAAPEDIRITVHQPAVVIEAPTVASITPDEVNGTQTIVFNLP